MTLPGAPKKIIKNMYVYIKDIYICLGNQFDAGLRTNLNFWEEFRKLSGKLAKFHNLGEVFCEINEGFD